MWMGASLSTARDGSEALRLARAHGGVLDLLLTDVVMPGMNGAELAARMRASRGDLRVLYLSGYSDELVSNPALLAEGAFLQKQRRQQPRGRGQRRVRGRAGDF